MASTVEQVKERLSIIEIVSSYLKLERTGVNYRARCPFHQEKTPSFFVSPARGGYYCFGCNRGGDLISFVQEIEGLDFLGALKLLAERAGVPLLPVDRRLQSVKERLYALLAAADSFYEGQLTSYREALAYLKNRGLNLTTIRSYRLGWAPGRIEADSVGLSADDRDLISVLTGQGFSEEEISQAGLTLSSSAGRPFDRFRRRLIFPLADSVGRVVGFSARVLPTDGLDAREPKYLNSPDTLLYRKSRLLYLYDRARAAIRTADRCILVEGQIDALMAHQGGFFETVAVSGTALSTDHLNLIKRLTNNLLMAFDPDPAGFRASRRAIEMALEEGLEVKVIALPSGVDPAELIRTKPDLWRQAVTGAQPVIDYLLEAISRGSLSFTDRRNLAKGIREEVFPLIWRLSSPLDQAHFIDKISILLGLPESAVRADLAVAESRLGVSLRDRSFSTGQSATVEKTQVDRLVSRRERLEENIFGLLFWQNDPAWLKLARQRFGQKTYQTLQRRLNDRRDQLALAAELAYSNSDRNLTEELSEVLVAWQEEVWREELIALLARVKTMKGSSLVELKPYLLKCQELSAKINKIKNYEQKS